MASVEDRLLALENWVKTEYGWAAKHWQIVAGITFVLGLIVGHLFK